MPTPKFPISHVLVDCENVGQNGLTDLVVNTDGSPRATFETTEDRLSICPIKCPIKIRIV